MSSEHICLCGVLCKRVGKYVYRATQREYKTGVVGCGWRFDEETSALLDKELSRFATRPSIEYVPYCEHVLEGEPLRCAIKVSKSEKNFNRVYFACAVGEPNPPCNTFWWLRDKERDLDDPTFNLSERCAARVWGPMFFAGLPSLKTQMVKGSSKLEQRMVTPSTSYSVVKPERVKLQSPPQDPMVPVWARFVSASHAVPPLGPDPNSLDGEEDEEAKRKRMYQAAGRWRRTMTNTLPRTGNTSLTNMHEPMTMRQSNPSNSVPTTLDNKDRLNHSRLHGHTLPLVPFARPTADLDPRPGHLPHS
ncbi:predicted protein [Nematostella vectensis]|uniref:Uncharacterized protein n=1 Tax=Nematostella vectensis TaxID=45351 RepID=A7S9Q2_NEMVE|nr:predicted protein [Nematostella vectensis]|eukprot:XP_001631586.1 predicted protein [Nematostella vectensis]